MTTTAEPAARHAGRSAGGPLSNRADFAKATWEKFTPRMTWSLSAKPDTDARVYVQFRDAAGNVSTVDGITSDSIRYQP